MANGCYHSVFDDIDHVDLDKFAEQVVVVGILTVDTRLRSSFGDEYGLTVLTGRNAGTKTVIRLPK